jgi:hypothetical protein
MTATQWETVRLSVCPDCLATDANGVASDDPDYVPDRVPLALLPDGYVGMNSPRCVNGCDGWYDESCAECEALAEPYFSWHPCEACGSTLGGDRYDVEIAIPVT